MTTITNVSEVVDLLSHLQSTLTFLAKRGAPGDRAHAFAIGEYQCRVCDYYISDLQNQVSSYQDSTSTDVSTLKEHIKLFNAALSASKEITVFWDTDIFLEDTEVSENDPSHCFSWT